MTEETVNCHVAVILIPTDSAEEAKL